MGLFTSNCPECNSPIGWFLQAPKDYVCKCGRSVSEKEIEDSWTNNYSEYIQSLIDKGELCKCKNVPKHCSCDKTTIVTQNHKVFPFIAKLIVEAVRSNGGINITRSEEDVLSKLDECLGAEGLTYDSLKTFEDWLSKLKEADFETIVDGEETEVKTIYSTAPSLGDPEDSVMDWVEQTYNHCI
jgi:hypothetical protein